MEIMNFYKTDAYDVAGTPSSSVGIKNNDVSKFDNISTLSAPQNISTDLNYSDVILNTSIDIQNLHATNVPVLNGTENTNIFDLNRFESTKSQSVPNHRTASLTAHSSQTPDGNVRDSVNRLISLKLHNPKKVTVGHLNINSIPNKFDGIMDMTKQNLDIFLISETKIDDSFPEAQFFCEG